jgi:hypothetical protein
MTPGSPAAAAPPEKKSLAVLDPVERLSEILFGLIMAMTFTGSIHAAQAGEEDLHTILVGAIGCNIAWGIVDAVMYVMSELVARGHVRGALRKLRSAASHDQVRDALDDVLPDGVVRAMKPSDYDGLRRWVDAIPEERRHAPMTGRLWRGAIGVFLLVTFSTFPVVIPLFLLRDVSPRTALRASHAVALTMLFLIGSALGKRAGMKPWLMGLSLLFIGVVLAAMTIALGG